VRGKTLVSLIPLNRIFLPSALILLACVGVYPQSSGESPSAAPADAVRARVERARGLAAAHQLETAANELEAVKKNAQDKVVRNVTSVMLMGIYLEGGSYARAESLLEETFRSHSPDDDASLRAYFAVAGQAVNGARFHLARYRSFGINFTDAGLPAEAVSDLDRLRSLIERMVAQAKEISGKRNAYDAFALLEDVVGIRLSLARDSEDRTKWESEYAGAREGLAGAQTEIASLGGIPAPQRSKVKPSSASPEVDPAPKDSNIESPSKPERSEPKTDTSTTSKPGGAGTDSSAKNANEPKTLSTSLLNARAIKRVLPVSPRLAKSVAAEGRVRVYVTVDEYGKVIEVSGSEGPLLLRQSAEDAARGWRFVPTAFAGRPVRLTGYIEFIFAP
jgi:TonB family protein